jgi:lipopolysaccharide assembly protein B
MLELLWLLIPLAAVSGWYAAILSGKGRSDRATIQISDEYIKGLNFLLNEQPDKALEIFIRIVEVDSDTVETHIVLGNLFRRRGEVDRAIRIHQNLIARPNRNLGHKADALLELGRDYLRAGLLDRAESLFKEVVQIGGQAAQAYRHLREIYEQEKDWANAIETAVCLQHDCGVPQAKVIAHYYCELGESAIAGSQYDLASKYAKKALGYDHACARASILLGDLAFDNADYKVAIRFYSDVHAQRQGFLPLVLPKLKEAHARRSDDKGYLRLLQRIRQENCSVSVVLSLVEELKRINRATVDDIFVTELSRPMVPLKMIREYIQANLEGLGEDSQLTLMNIAKALDSHLERQASHLCNRCGLVTRGLYWQCPRCHGWGTIKPTDQINGAQKSPLDSSSIKHPRASN